MKNLLLLFTIVIFFSCKTTKKVESPVSIKVNETIELTVKNTYQKGEKIQVVIKNIGSNPFFLMHPKEKFFEKQVGDQWKNVKILYCPCDAPCAAPPEKTELKPGMSYTIQWNQKTSYCGEKQENGVRQTIEKQVEPGKYRIKIMYSVDMPNVRELYQEFEIK